MTDLELSRMATLVGKHYGKMKRGKKEKPSPAKKASSSANLALARAKRWAK